TYPHGLDAHKRNRPHYRWANAAWNLAGPLPVRTPPRITPAEDSTHDYWRLKRAIAGGSARLSIYGAHEPQRFLVRQNLLLHLVHHIRESDLVFRIGKGVRAAGARMSKSARRHAKEFSRGIARIFHETCGEGGWYLENAVHAIDQCGAHPCHCLLGKEALPIELAAVCEHGIEPGQGAGAADPAKGDNRLRANRRLIHGADRLQTARRGERPVSQRAGCGKIGIEALRLGWPADLWRVNGGCARVFLLRQADPKIETEWPGKICLPVIRYCFACDSANEFIEKKSKRARVIAVRRARRPQRALRFQRVNHRRVI